MEKLISPNQSAFIKGRLISENILLAHESHYPKANTATSPLSVASGRETPCHRSSFSFAWKASHILPRNFSEASCRGISIGRQCPELNSLFFADDVLIFGKADLQHAMCIKASLDEFKAISGQLISPQKSAIFFSKNAAQNIKNVVSSALKITYIGCQDKYLGFPPIITRSKKHTFEYTIAKICQRMEGWSSRFLYRARKAILIKSVLATIPSYTMYCFFISDSLCKRIDQLCSNFWWSSKYDKRSLHWMKWTRLSRGWPRFQGMPAHECCSTSQAWMTIAIQPRFITGGNMERKIFPSHELPQRGS
ncbi:hypothetical protein Cni_G29092 [Canna indica]|uniref:Reverse transcriptase n=1 Tax=Canna indica TaxID=4628 RepID=A0AAQ3L7P8_9LILI|nr:hypothetical protein Cni_G29092 [Canna indica]